MSLNTAAAIRVGKHRITYQQVPGRSGTKGAMQLLIDGKAVELPEGGLKLGGGRIASASPEGGLDVKLADGTRLIITSHFWDSQGYWYLNVEVLDTPAREGTMGHILPGNWLPLAADGSSFGPAPASLDGRHVLLNQKFADAWRVTDTTSLFDYAPGTSTANFTDYNWPPKPGAPCRATVSPWGNPPGADQALALKPSEGSAVTVTSQSDDDIAGNGCSTESPP